MQLEHVNDVWRNVKELKHSNIGIKSSLPKELSEWRDECLRLRRLIINNGGKSNVKEIKGFTELYECANPGDGDEIWLMKYSYTSDWRSLKESRDAEIKGEDPPTD